MNEMFSQGGKGSTGILTNKQAIARKFGVKQSEVLYYSQFIALSGYKVIYDKATQKAYSLPTDIPSDAIATNLTQAGVLYYGSTSVDLGALAVQREEYITLPGSFSTGVTVNTKNELVIFTDGKYRWDGELPKIVPAGSTPASTGGVSPSAWMPVGDVTLRKELGDASDVLKGDALLAVKQPYTGAVARTQHDRNKDYVFVTDFGAKGDGVTDDTGAFAAALLSSRTVLMPDGIFRVSSIELKDDQTLVGSGNKSAGSHIKALNPTGNLITMSGSKATLKDVYIDATPGFVTSGNFIYATGFGRHVIDNVEMWNAYNGITIDSSSNVTVISPRIYSSKGVPINVEGGFNHSILDAHSDNPTSSQPIAGIRVTAVGDLTIHGAKMLQCGIALLLDVKNGGFINSLTASQCFFDSSNQACIIRSTGTGHIQRVDFTDCWFGNSTTNAVSISKTGSGQVTGIAFNNPRICINGGDGLRIGGGVENVRVFGGQYSQCSGSGISVAGELYMLGGCIGLTDGLTGNSTGVYIESTANGFIQSAKLNANTTAVTQASSNFKLRDVIGYKTSNIGTMTAVTGPTGEITVPHGLAGAPTWVDGTIYEYSAAEVRVTSADASNIVFRIRNTNDNSPVAGVSKTIRWKAEM